MGQFNAGFRKTMYKYIIIYEICPYSSFFCNKLQFNTRKKNNTEKTLKIIKRIIFVLLKFPLFPLETIQFEEMLKKKF